MAPEWKSVFPTQRCWGPCLWKLYHWSRSWEKREPLSSWPYSLEGKQLGAVSIRKSWNKDGHGKGEMKADCGSKVRELLFLPRFSRCSLIDVSQIMHRTISSNFKLLLLFWNIFHQIVVVLLGRHAVPGERQDSLSSSRCHSRSSGQFFFWSSAISKFPN